MQPVVGEILEGKVTGITRFGAFVALPDGKSGLVHISEIANTYVNDVHDHVTEGQTVKVRVLSVTEDGKINLSIKKAEVPVQTRAPRPRPAHSAGQSAVGGGSGRREAAAQSPAEPSFEDRLKQFMQESDSKNSGNRLYANRKNPSRRRRD